MKAKFYARQFISSSKVLSKFLHAILRLVNKKKFAIALKKSRNIPFYSDETKPVVFPVYPSDSAIDNDLYGIGEILKEYSGFKGYSNAYIEHGVFFGNHVQFDQKIHWTKKIITFGNIRREHLKNHDIRKSIIPVGPYINYAKNNISADEFTTLKSSLGKVLLVIPGHSSTNYQASFDTHKLIEEARTIGKRFKTIVVLMYYRDLECRRRYQPYLDAGFRVYSAGHKFDPSFMNRLRTIISLADYTISNTVGSHIGYCVALGKPHYLINQRFEELATSSIENDLYSEFHEIRLRELDDVSVEFRKFTSTISEGQLKVVEKYWGHLKPLSKSELRDALRG